MNNKLCLIFTHSDPDYTYLIDTDNPDDLEDGEMIVTPIHEIQPGKRTLIANDDEAAWVIVENVTNSEWEDILKKAYKKVLITQDFEEVDPLMLYFEPEDFPQTEKDFINYCNKVIDESYVNGDSEPQYVWYSQKDIMSLSEYRDDYC